MIIKCVETGSKGNSYILMSSSGESLIIECGVRWGIMLKALNYNVLNVVGCIVSHIHSDHLRSYIDLLRNGIQIYSNKEVCNYVESISGEKIICLKEKRPFKLSEFELIPFYLPHTTRDKETGTLIPCPNFGYLIKNSDEVLLYATDFEYIPYTFKNQRINYMLLECNHMDDLMDSGSANYVHALKGHSSVSTVRDIILTNKTPDLRNVILCHLSSENADSDRMKSEIQEVAGKRVTVDIAEKGKEWELLRFPF